MVPMRLSVLLQWQPAQPCDSSIMSYREYSLCRGLIWGRSIVFLSSILFTSTTPTVTGIYIEGDPAFIQNSSSAPTDRRFATWYYQSDSLIIQTENFEVIDSIRINFVQTLPSSGSGAYASRINARLDSIGIQNASANPSWTVTVTPATAHHFIKLSPETSLRVGTNRTIQVRLEDEFNNVIDGSTVTFTRTSSGNGYFGTPGNADSSVVTSGGGLAAVPFTASSLLANSPDVITVSIGSVSTTFTLPLVPEDADTFIVITGTEDPIEVGTERLLQVQLEDVFGNSLRDSLVTFLRFNGNGVFPDNGTNTISVTTGINGIAEALYQASDSTSFIDDSIQVSFNGVLDTLVLGLLPGTVSYYEFTPAAPQVTTAGVGVNYTVTARDLYGNAVNNSDNIVFTLSGSSSAVFTPDDTISFSGTSTVNVTVTDTIVGSFTIAGVKQGTSGVTGQSGLITVNPTDADHFVIIAGTENPIEVGTERLLQVRLEDVYGNDLT